MHAAPVEQMVTRGKPLPPGASPVRDAGRGPPTLSAGVTDGIEAGQGRAGKREGAGLRRKKDPEAYSQSYRKADTLVPGTPPH